MKDPQSPYRPTHVTVHAEIPVTDLDRGIAFYRATTGVELTRTDDGPNPMAMFQPADPDTGVGGHLYPGKPATDGAGPTVHLAAPGKIEDVAKRVVEAGGRVLSEPIAIPAGRFIYCLDPFGNSIGFFEET